MTQEQKDKLISMIETYIDSTKEDLKIAPKMIGTLNKVIGINGFKKAEIGSPIWDSGDRYFIMLENIEGTRSLEVAYYKDTLSPFIDFYDKSMDIKG